MNKSSAPVQTYDALCRDVAAYFAQRRERAAAIKRLQRQIRQLMKEQTMKHHAAYRLLDTWRRTGDTLPPEQAAKIRERHGLDE